MTTEQWLQVEAEFKVWDEEGMFGASQRQILDWFKAKFLSSSPVLFPSPKEIKAEAQKRWGDYFQMRDAFELGAEWMKEKLGNGSEGIIIIN